MKVTEMSTVLIKNKWKIQLKQMMKNIKRIFLKIMQLHLMLLKAAISLGLAMLDLQQSPYINKLNISLTKLNSSNCSSKRSTILPFLIVSLRRPLKQTKNGIKRLPFPQQ
jgi:hypothetical protein